MGTAIIYPIGEQSFENLRNRGKLYVDKTELIFKLITEGDYYFLSRPRRFGKSLLVSTLEAYFLGRKELFAGLAMERLERDWKEHPVLHVDFSRNNFAIPGELEKTLNSILCKWEAIYGRKVEDDTYADRFVQVIESAHARTGQQAVVLVDEYDKPMLDAIGNRELLARNQQVLRGFYGALKASAPHLRFVFLTGVTRFAHVNIFSGLNNLWDISMSTEYATLCGITEAELHANFAEGVVRMAARRGQTEAQVYDKLKAMYDGYRFSEEVSEGVYNPFSLLSAFGEMKYGSYWFATGTPTYLVQVMQESGYWVDDLMGKEVTLQALGDIKDPYQNPQALFYQAGYLTLGGRGRRKETYRLRFPNGEVKKGFKQFVQECYLPGVFGGETYNALVFHRLLAKGDAEGFMALLASFFWVSNYEVMGEQEKYYQNTLRALFMLMGSKVEAEHRTANGRIDLLVWLPKYVYLFEIKMDRGAEVALEQIEGKGYAKGVDTGGRQLIAIGVSFSRAERGIQEWKVARG